MQLTGTLIAPTAGLILISIFLYIIYYFLYQKRWFRKIKEETKFNIIFAFCFVVVFSLIPFFSSDFFHMIEMVSDIVTQTGTEIKSHLETPYIELALLSKGNYILWRIIVWGSTTFVIVLTAKRLSVDIITTLWILIIVYGVEYTFGRVVLPESLYFLGLTLWIKPIKKHRLISYLLGAILIVVGPFFHSSMWLLLGLSFTAFLPNFLNINSKILIFLTIFSILIVLINVGLIWSVDNSLFNDDQAISDKLTYYQVNSTTGTNYFNIINDFFSLIFRIDCLYLIYNGYKKIKKYKSSTFLSLYFKIIISTFIIGYALLIAGINFDTFSYRILILSFIPSLISLTYLWQKNCISKRQIALIAYYGIFHTLGYMFYTAYASI